MFKFNDLRRRVSFKTSHGSRRARIERQNTPGLYIWGFVLSSVMFVLLSKTVWEAAQSHREDVLYLLPILVLLLVAYFIAIAICLWGGLGVEEIEAGPDEFRWTRILLKWRRTKHIPYRSISEIKAVTPWSWLSNKVEVIAGSKLYGVGQQLLRDEAIELADFLKKSARLP